MKGKMNSSETQDRPQLEAATSRSLAPDAALDAETSSLREGFITLGRVVEAASADYDEAALIARVRSACADQTPAVEVRRRSSPWPLVLGGALALSALIAIVRIVVTWPAANDAVVHAPSAPTRTNDSPREPSPTQVAGDGAEAMSADQSALAWDDSLDEEIAAAQSRLADMSGSLTGIDGTLSNINQTLEALSDDLSGGSL
jgi:hypothetical protein